MSPTISLEDGMPIVDERVGCCGSAVAVSQPHAETPPDLQIIPDALWNRVQRRLADNAAAYLRDAKTGELSGRPLGSAVEGIATIAKENVSVGHGPPRRLLGSLGGRARWSLAIGRPGRRSLARPDPAVDGDGYQVYGRIGRESCHRGIARRGKAESTAEIIG